MEILDLLLSIVFIVMGIFFLGENRMINQIEFVRKFFSSDMSLVPSGEKKTQDEP